jgi:hypothetical protein
VEASADGPEDSEHSLSVSVLGPEADSDADGLESDSSDSLEEAETAPPLITETASPEEPEVAGAETPSQLLQAASPRSKPSARGRAANDPRFKREQSWVAADEQDEHLKIGQAEQEDSEVNLEQLKDDPGTGFSLDTTTYPGTDSDVPEQAEQESKPDL